MIYTIGETVLDILFKNNQPIASKAGGSALNTAISLAQLGNKVSFISEIGDDETGRFCEDFLEMNNVNTQFLTKNISYKSSIALAFLNQNNDATYTFYKDLPEIFTCKNISFRSNDIVLFSSSFAISKRARVALLKIIHDAQSQNAIIMYDPNMRKKLMDNSFEKEYIFENFSKAHIVRASDEDCVNIFNSTNFMEIYSQLQKLGVAVLIITKNSGAVEVFAQNLHLQFTVPKINPISTIGAGDTCNAGIIHKIHELGISAAQISMISKEAWDLIIPFSIACSSKVCMSLENYLQPQDIQDL